MAPLDLSRQGSWPPVFQRASAGRLCFHRLMSGLMVDSAVVVTKRSPTARRVPAGRTLAPSAAREGLLPDDVTASRPGRAERAEFINFI